MKSLFTLLLLIATCSAQATLITLDLDKYDQDDFLDETLDDGDQAIAGPLVLTFTNILTSDGTVEGEIGGNGLYFSLDDDDNELVSIDLMFNIDVRLINVDIDREDNAQKGEFWFEQGSNRSDNMIGEIGNIAYEAGTIPYFRANTVYTLRHNITNDDFFQIDEFVLEAVNVPEPSTVILFLLSIFGLMGHQRKVNQ